MARVVIPRSGSALRGLLRCKLQDLFREVRASVSIPIGTARYTSPSFGDEASSTNVEMPSPNVELPSSTEEQSEVLAAASPPLPEASSDVTNPVAEHPGTPVPPPPPPSSSPPSPITAQLSPEGSRGFAAEQGRRFKDSRPGDANAVVDGSICIKLQNVPKYALKSDILRYFNGAGLTPDRVALSFDTRYRAKHWYLEFDSIKNYSIACGLLMTNKYMWTRAIRMDRVSKPMMMNELREVNVSNFRDRSLILINLPEDVRVVDIEHLFEGHRISGHGIKIYTIMHDLVRTPPRLRLQGERRNELRNVLEKRALVRFATEMDALRALRERQGEFVWDRAVELKFLR